MPSKTVIFLLSPDKYAWLNTPGSFSTLSSPTARTSHRNSLSNTTDLRDSFRTTERVDSRLSKKAPFVYELEKQPVHQTASLAEEVPRELTESFIEEGRLHEVKHFLQKQSPDAVSVQCFRVLLKNPTQKTSFCCCCRKITVSVSHQHLQREIHFLTSSPSSPFLVCDLREVASVVQCEVSGKRPMIVTLWQLRRGYQPIVVKEVK